jgi:hypothetical protein
MNLSGAKLSDKKVKALSQLEKGQIKGV